MGVQVPYTGCMHTRSYCRDVCMCNNVTFTDLPIAGFINHIIRKKKVEEVIESGGHTVLHCRLAMTP